MNKMLLFSVIITILTMLWLIISYYSYDRYINLSLVNNKKIEKYIDNYKNIPSSDNNVILILTIKSDDLKDINKLYSTLLSLLDQTIRVNDIRLYIIEPNTDIKIPSKLKDIATIYNIPDNTDKITYPLYKIEDENSVLLYVKPSIIYGKDFIEYILDDYKKNKNNIFTYDNNILLLTPKNYKINNNKIELDKTCPIYNIIYKENYKLK